MYHIETPRLKPIVEYYSSDGNIYFFHRPGIAIQLKDSSRFIACLCSEMDGKKTTADLKQSLSEKFPKETPYLEKLLSVLDKENLLEDTLKNIPHYLSEYDAIRWSRNIEFFGSYCTASENKFSYQEKLSQARITVFGLGGVGSNILYNLVAMGVRNIKAVDFDNVELSNLNRQIMYNESDIGKLKTEAARQRISEFMPDAAVEFINSRIINSHDIEEIICGQDMVVAAIDSPRDKIIDWFNLACVNQSVPFICGSLDSKFVTYFTIMPGKTGCVECWKASKKESGLIYQDILVKNGFIPAQSSNVGIMPLISLVAGFVTSEILKAVTGIVEMQSAGKLLAYDFISSQIMVHEQWNKKHDCLVCSHV